MLERCVARYQGISILVLELTSKLGSGLFPFSEGSRVFYSADVLESNLYQIFCSHAVSNAKRRQLIAALKIGLRRIDTLRK